MCIKPTKSPPRPKPAFVGTKINPAEAGDQFRTTIAYVGVKKRTDQRAIIEVRPERQVNRTLRIRSTSIGMMGSDVYLDSINRNPAKVMRHKSIGVSWISDEAKLNSTRKTEALCKVSDRCHSIS
jgi:hypothetical protein